MIGDERSLDEEIEWTRKEIQRLEKSADLYRKSKRLIDKARTYDKLRATTEERQEYL